LTSHAARIFFGICLFASFGCEAEDRIPSAFVKKDEWVFEQVRETPGKKQEINSEIRFTVMKLADTWIAHAIAVTDEKVPVWDLKWKLPLSSCIQDFVGQSDLGLLVSCGTPLSIGLTWDDETISGNEKTVSKYVVESQEDIRVMAGHFAAVRIIEAGKIFQQQTAGPDRLKLTFKTSYWFSHDAKAFVRIVREYRAPAGTRQLLISEELKSYKVQPPGE
jgi:hypothetical protein